MVEAVLNHPKLNDSADNLITITLKDADRLANLGPNAYIRSGQLYHYLPAYDPRYIKNPNPAATFSDPKTVLHDIRCALEWEQWLRLPRAKEIGKKYFDHLRAYLNDFEKQIHEAGLVSFCLPEE